MEKLRTFLGKVFNKINNTINRKRLKNQDFSLFAPTCIAGVIYHKLGKKFLSPTINLFMSERDFLKFAKDVKYYSDKELQYVEMQQGVLFMYPVCTLGDGDKKITIHFNHYPTFEQAKEKWDERMQRINYDNMFFVFSTRDRGGHLTYDEIKSIGEIKAKGLVCFTAKDYKEFDYTLQLKKYKNADFVGPYMVEHKTKIFNRMVWEPDFDYTYWLNTGKVKK